MCAVQALVDKSLLQVWAPAGPSRLDIDEPYSGMYRSIHEYAHGKLHDVGPEATRGAEQRHGRYFATFGSEEASNALSLRAGTRRRHALALEIDNPGAACRRALPEREAKVAASNFRAAWEVMRLHGPVGPGAVLGEQMLGLEEIGPLTRAQAMGQPDRHSKARQRPSHPRAGDGLLDRRADARRAPRRSQFLAGAFARADRRRHRPAAGGHHAC